MIIEKTTWVENTSLSFVLQRFIKRLITLSEGSLGDVNCYSAARPEASALARLRFQ